MKKSDLKFGNVIETRNKERYLCHITSDNLNNLNGTGFMYMCSLNEELKCKHKEDCDVVKVYEDYTCGKVLWVRPQKPTLSEDEKTILRNVDKTYKYIARDKDNDLYIYAGKPEKKDLNFFNPQWVSSGKVKDLPFSHLFQFIKWEDKEPYSIQDLLDA